MLPVDPAAGRARYDEDGYSLRISWHPRRSLFGGLFIAAWLGGWFCGEKSAIHQRTKGPAHDDRGFLMFWLIAWTIGGAAAAFSLIWMMFGREILSIGPDGLTLRRQVLGLGITRQYDPQHVRRLRLEPRPTDTFSRRTQGFGWGTGDGAVAFDYGAKTIRCGAPLDEAEARIVVARLIQRDRRLSSEGAA